MNPEVMIHAEQITKRYKMGQDDIIILNEISFRIKKGEMVALVGPSGSGKTTLLNILGLLDLPSSGKLRIGEYDLQTPKQKREELRRSLIGNVFQQFHLLPQFSAIDNVCLPLVPVKTDFDVRERAKMLLDRVGLGERANHRPAELSGGEQQRVAIARSLINSPQILLCDEPTGNLDSKNRDSILDLLSELNRDGFTIIIATHDPEVAKRCQYTMEIRDGKIAVHV
jgi:ABC-type lipoprotein export system ATPase subunit